MTKALPREVSFISRQKELQSLHRQLQSVLTEMGQISPLVEQNFGFGDDVSPEEEDEPLFCLERPEISSEQEIRLLIREIQQLQSDVEDIQHSIEQRCKHSRKSRVTLMIQQLAELSHVLDGQLYRADKLLQ
jgi:hypothetical protein